jgi:hypothetical protein
MLYVEALPSSTRSGSSALTHCVSHCGLIQEEFETCCAQRFNLIDKEMPSYAMVIQRRGASIHQSRAKWIPYLAYIAPILTGIVTARAAEQSRREMHNFAASHRSN